MHILVLCVYIFHSIKEIISLHFTKHVKPQISFVLFFLIESGLFTNWAIREALNIDRCLEIKIVQVRCLPKRKKKSHYTVHYE